jgi:hypothetical protein
MRAHRRTHPTRPARQIRRQRDRLRRQLRLCRRRAMLRRPVLGRDRSPHARLHQGPLHGGHRLRPCVGLPDGADLQSWAWRVRALRTHPGGSMRERPLQRSDPPVLLGCHQPQGTLRRGPGPEQPLHGRRRRVLALSWPQGLWWVRLLPANGHRNGLLELLSWPRTRRGLRDVRGLPARGPRPGRHAATLRSMRRQFLHRQALQSLGRVGPLRQLVSSRAARSITTP